MYGSYGYTDETALFYLYIRTIRTSVTPAVTNYQLDFLTPGISPR